MKAASIFADSDNEHLRFVYGDENSKGLIKITHTSPKEYVLAKDFLGYLR